MNTYTSVILRTIAPLLTSLMTLFSFFVLLRGHDEPGGGFIAGLITASAFAIYGIACGVQPVRRALHFHPITISGFGLLLAAGAGIPAALQQKTYLTGLWLEVYISNNINFKLSTPLVFDIGVFLVVVGAITGIALALEEKDYG